MKSSCPILFLVIATLGAPDSLADRSRQRCEIVSSSAAGAPRAVVEYAISNKESAIKRCVQIDLKTETYFTLGPIRKAGDICYFSQDQLYPPLAEAPAKLQLMARVNNECPNRQSLRYIPAHDVSATQFAGIITYLQDFSSSENSFQHAVSGLSPEQRGAASASSLLQEIRRGGQLSLTRVSGTRQGLGLWSSFDLYISDPYDADKFHVLTVRDLFGRLKLTEISIGID